MSKYTVPLTEEEQYELLSQLEQQKKEAVIAQRKIQNLEKASNFLSVMIENAERVRDLNEQQILMNKQRAEEASQAKSTFLAQMSHEIRTPMNAIKVLSELLMRTNLDKLQKDYASNIVSASSSLLNIINDILDFSKLDAKMFEIVNGPYDFPSLINDISNIINLRALDKNIAFVTDVSSAIPSMLYGDDLRIKQIFLNVLQNAVKFTNEGYVRLTVQCKEHSDNGYITLECIVEDTGIGIKEEYMDTLFEPFSQAELINNKQPEGTGLGLSITKSLLDLMEGAISLNTRYGQGSTFTFEIPQKIIDKTPIAHIAEPEAKKILVAGPLLKADACIRMLTRLGIPCHAANDIPTARGFLDKNKYTHIVYYYDGYQSLMAENASNLRDCKLISIKDIRYAGRQQTHQLVQVLYEPVLIYELSRTINDSDDDYSDSQQYHNDLGKFTINQAHILIVDDNQVNLMVMDQLLKQYNVNALLANSGMEAIDLTENYKFDIIFMDHMMPLMDGTEAAKKIRNPNNLNYNTPIIVVTANAIAGMREEYLAMGFDDYISKPIDIKVLNGLLKKWISKNKISEISYAQETDAGTDMSTYINRLSSLGLNCQEVCRDMGYNESTYAAIIDTFINSVPDTMEKIVEFKARNDLEAFRIHVHGIKSALANIGAKSLSKTAQNLELAAIEKNRGLIDHSFSDFYSETTSLVIGIKSVKPKEVNNGAVKQSVLKKLNKEQWMEKLTQISRLLDNLESIDALEQLSELKSRLDTDMQDKLSFELDNIKISIENFDYELAVQRIQAVIATY